MNKTRLILSAAMGALLLTCAIPVFSAAGSDATAEKRKASANVAEVTPVASLDSDRLPVLTRGKVYNIQKTSFDKDKISLTWDAVDGADGYFVYICDMDASGSEDYTRAAQVSEPQATIDGLQSGTQYWCRVAPYTLIHGEPHENAGTVKKTATQMGEVSGLRLVRSGEVMEFCWDAAENATGYRVYRSADGGRYQLIGELSAEETDFTDETAENGVQYNYKVCANRSLYHGVNYPSDGAVIRLVCGMSSPGDLIAISEASRVNLSWNDNRYATGYNIYMAEGNGEYEYLDATERNYYNTDKLTPEQTYSFRIEPYQTLGEGVEARGTYNDCTIKVVKPEPKQSPSVSGDGTYIEISISQQHMWYFENGKLVLDTDVVTGDSLSNCDTPTGRYSIESRATNTTLTGPGYSSFVNFWMGFYGGYGIHDASWRSSYGGRIYQGNGSHGCVNTPYDKVKELYERTGYGTPVIVY